MKKTQTDKKRPRLGATEWAQLLADQERSGQRVKIYCAARGVSVASYYRWQKLLRQKSGGGLFRPIEITTQAEGGVVVELPGGVILRFSELPPVAFLRSLSSAFSTAQP